MQPALETFDHLDLAKAAAILPREELYDAWAAARDETRYGYEAWCAAPWAAKGEAHAVYVAALDREAAAAELYRHSVSRDA